MLFGSLGRRALIGALVAIGVAFLGPALPSYPLTLLTQALIVATLAVSLDGRIVHSSAPHELLDNEEVKSRYLGVA